VVVRHVRATEPLWDEESSGRSPAGGIQKEHS
jgi:hypothetical protein